MGGLWLVFAAGAKPPGVAALRGPLMSLPGVATGQEFAPRAATDRAACLGAGEPLFELVVDGLAFDLCGRVCEGDRLRAEGEPRDVIEALRPLGGRDALLLAPGPHLAAAASTLPVVRAMTQLGARIAAAVPGIECVVWPPAEWSVEPAGFARAIAPWSDGGAFPAPGLVQFRPTLDGSVQSVGLAFFTGQELRIEGGMAADPSYAHRLAARLAQMLVHRGRLVEVEQFAGPSGEQLSLAPSANGRYVRARMG